MLPLLDNLIHDPPGKVLPVDRALDNRFQSDSSPPQRRNPFPRVDAVETAEAILIPRQDDREVAPSSASRIICMNPWPLMRLRSADAVVFVPADNLILPLSESYDLGPLLLGLSSCLSDDMRI